MAEQPIEWDIDANLPLYTRDWLKNLDLFVHAYRIDGKLFHPDDVEIIRTNGANPVPRLIENVEILYISLDDKPNAFGYGIDHATLYLKTEEVPNESGAEAASEEGGGAAR